MYGNDESRLKRGWRAQVVGASFTLVLGLLVAPSFAQSDDADKAGQEKSEPTTETTTDLRESAHNREGASGAAGSSAGHRVEDVSLNLTLQSARIELTNLDDDEDEFVVYRFADERPVPLLLASW